MPVSRWRRYQSALLDGFIVSNYAFLCLDVFLAHSVNRFRHEAEWIPVYFSIVATVLLAPGLIGRRHRAWAAFSRRGALLVGGSSIGLGLAGIVYHLNSQFFTDFTIRSLVYTAPFAAPLAYTGLGFLVLVNKMIPTGTEEWRQWVQFFALGGFVGNFLLALCDHAQNGFFHVTEWLPVVSSALAIGFLSLSLVERNGSFLRLCLGVLVVQAGVGGLGFYLHVVADINGLSSSLFENFVHGAPVFAPLLFIDLAVLWVIGFAPVSRVLST